MPSITHPSVSPEQIRNASDVELKRQFDKLEQQLRPGPSGFLGLRPEVVRSEQLLIQAELQRRAAERSE